MSDIIRFSRMLLSWMFIFSIWMDSNVLSNIYFIEIVTYFVIFLFPSSRSSHRIDIEPDTNLQAS